MVSTLSLEVDKQSSVTHTVRGLSHLEWGRLCKKTSPMSFSARLGRFLASQKPPRGSLLLFLVSREPPAGTHTQRWSCTDSHRCSQTQTIKSIYISWCKGIHSSSPQAIPLINSLTPSFCHSTVTPVPQQHPCAACHISVSPHLSLLLWLCPSPPPSRPLQSPSLLGPPPRTTTPRRPQPRALRMPPAPRPLAVPPSLPSSLPPSSPLPRASAPASLHPSLCRSRIATAYPAEPSQAQAPAPARPSARRPSARPRPRAPLQRPRRPPAGAPRLRTPAPRQEAGSRSRGRRTRRRRRRRSRRRMKDRTQELRSVSLGVGKMGGRDPSIWGARGGGVGEVLGRGDR